MRHTLTYIIFIQKIIVHVCVCVRERERERERERAGGYQKPFNCDLNRSFSLKSYSWMLHQRVHQHCALALD